MRVVLDGGVGMDEGECPLTLTLSHQGRENRAEELSPARGERRALSPLPRRERTKVRVILDKRVRLDEGECPLTLTLSRQGRENNRLSSPSMGED